MNEVIRIHRQAMEVADQAQFELDHGDPARAQALFAEAWKLEAAAVEGMADQPGLERAVLLRSAAALALEAQELLQAERFLARGLLEDASDQIHDEMRDLLEQVHFQRHLDLRGLVLDVNEVQMSIAGDAIGYGFASSDEFVTRVHDFERLLYRTAERRAGRDYREGGSPKKRIKETFEVYLSVPRAASFAVTLRLGRPKDQMDMPVMLGQPSVITETLDLLELAQAREFRALEERIPDKSYRRNFVALAKKLAPDGKNVAVVGFTARRDGQERRVSLTLPKERLVEPKPAPVEPTETFVSVRGLLKFADDTGTKVGKIKLVEDSGKTHVISVPHGMMTDIVKPLWDDEVVVRGELNNGVIELDEIDKADV